MNRTLDRVAVSLKLSSCVTVVLLCNGFATVLVGLHTMQAQ